MVLQINLNWKLSMRLLVQIVPLVVGLALSGCSSWNPFSKTESKKPAELVQVKSSAAVKQQWTLSVGRSENYFFVPAVDGNSGFAAAADGSVLKFEVTTGRQLWKVNAGSRLTAGVAAGDGLLVVAGEKGKIFGLSSVDGAAKWTVSESSEILSIPLVSSGTVILRTNENKIIALDAASGVRKWMVERPLPTLTLRAASGMIVAGDALIAALPGGKLIAVSLGNGAIKWEAVVGEPKGATELERVADVMGIPSVVGKTVCAVTYQGRVGCFDVQTGAQRWVKPVSSEVGASADERFVFAADVNGVVTAYAKEGGASVWKNDKLLYRGLSSPVSFGNVVAVGDFAGYIHFLSREDGAFAARLQTDGSSVLGNPVVAGSRLIVQTKGGSVVSVGIE